jgi:hypothetical protein
MHKAVLYSVLMALPGLLPAAAAEEEVTVTALGAADPLDVAYVEKVAGPTRVLWITLRRDGTSEKKQRVTLKGPLNQADLQSLLSFHFSRNDEYWKPKTTYRPYVKITGDAHRLKLEDGYVCGLLCGSGATYWYTRDGTSWHYLYKSDEWIS